MVRTTAGLSSGAAALCVLVTALFSGADARATEHSTMGHGELEAAITSCREIATSTGRLDCYDAIELDRLLSAAQNESTAAAGAATAVTTAPDSTPSPVDSGGQPSREEVFGFEFDVKEALQSVTTEVVEVGKNAKGGLVLTLANGQTWQQSDNQTLYIYEGDSVTINRGALSAFYLTRDGKGRRYKFARAK